MVAPLAPVVLLGSRSGCMSKLLELSILFATIAIPARAARHKSPQAGLRKMVINVLIFEAFYLFFLRFLHGRI
jgi:hypothetical protein